MGVTSEFWTTREPFSSCYICYQLLPVTTSRYQSLPVATSATSCYQCYQLLPVATSCYQLLPVATSCYQSLPVATSVFFWLLLQVATSRFRWTQVDDVCFDSCFKSLPVAVVAFVFLSATGGYKLLLLPFLYYLLDVTTCE